MDDFRVVVVGGSAGAVETVMKLCSQLPADLNAAVFICIHVSAMVPSALPELIARRTQLTTAHAKDGETIEKGHIYIAPPDNHLLLARDKVRLGHGPRENGHRPAIDPLFRSAANSYGRRTVGVILSGNLDDGTAGLREIRRLGGNTIIQDPADAEFASMPWNALETVGADRTVTADQLAQAIVEFVNAPLPEKREPEITQDVAAGGSSPVLIDERAEGLPSVFGCPDCGGVLWELRQGELIQYRCRVGHAYSDESLVDAQNEGIERALWTALRALEEGAQQARQLARRMRNRGQGRLAARFSKRAVDAERKVETLRTALFHLSPPNLEESA